MIELCGNLDYFWRYIVQDPDAERAEYNAADVLVVTSMTPTTARVGKPAEDG
jgi:hypothetical protein